LKRLAVSVGVALVLVASSAYAGGRGQIVVIGAGAAPATGVKATAISYDATRVGSRDGVRPARPGGAAPSSVRSSVPVPVAISAHNCVPRLDPRGVSLSLEFSEGAADCISFVSPAPAPERNVRRRTPPRAPDPERLALAAYERVISLAPDPEIEIAPGRIGLTGLDSFFWAGNELRPVSATARAGRLTVTAEARPVRFLWDYGDGATGSTTHPGRPWTPRQPGDVSHLYETKGRYRVGLEVIWAARWRTNAGPWRDLGYFSTGSSEPYRVRGAIAVLVRDR
jgi:hypothetical protein